MRTTFLTLGFLFLGAVAAAQSPSLLKDINTQFPPSLGSNPTGYDFRDYAPWDNYRFPRIGSSFLFFAGTRENGCELWKSLPVPLTAVLVKDILPGNRSSIEPPFVSLTSFGDKVLFRANDGVHGQEPWITDGTSMGTFLLKDTVQGEGSGYCYFPVTDGGKVFWCSRDPWSGGFAVWVSDGTTNGTRKVYSGLNGPWNKPAASGGKVFFWVSIWPQPSPLFVTDGTNEGTHAVSGVQVSGRLGSLVVVGGKCYFFAPSGSGSFALYSTDGINRVKIKDGFSGIWDCAIPLGNKIFFQGSDSQHGSEPWITDGTGSGTILLKDISQGAGSGGFRSPVAMGGKMYFQALNPSGAGYGIWVSDGTPAGTKPVSAKSSCFQFPACSGDTIFFYGSGNGHGDELWKTDGTDEGTMEVRDIWAGSHSSWPLFITPVPGGKVVFAADDGVHGREIWVSDGTAAGTRLLADIYGRGGTESSFSSGFLDLPGVTYFTADDGVHGRELWKTDGTAGGTMMVKDVNEGAGSGSSLESSRMEYWRKDGTWRPTALGKVLFFKGFTPEAGEEIWKTDGTPGGTVMVKDIRPGTGSGGFYHGCVFKGKIYFFADDGSGYGLWKTDGTPGGTAKVAGGFISPWENPFAFNGRIYFQGETQDAGKEPWTTDGTPAGTRMLKDILPGTGSGEFQEPVAMGGKVYFKAAAGNGGYGIWVTTGTRRRTRLVFSAGRSVGDNLTVLGNKLFFLGWDAGHGSEPWVSDGSRAGTRLLKDLNSAGDGGFFDPCVTGGVLFFRAIGTGSGSELWKTDGTETGTVMVKDIRPGPGSGNPCFLTAAGSRRLVFQADDGIHGKELWVSDGTPGGTVMVLDLRSGSSGSDPQSILLSGGRIFFQADDGSHGAEPWTWFPGANAKPFGFGTTDLLRLTSTDPALGSRVKLGIAGLGRWQWGLIFQGRLRAEPRPFRAGWIYFDSSSIRRVFLVSGRWGGFASYTVPDDPALVGLRLVCQGFVHSWRRWRRGLDLTEAVLQTYGR